MKIVEDPAFIRLMKTGRLHYKLPSAKMLGRDAHVVFRRVKGQIKKMLKVSFFSFFFFLPI